MARKKGFAVSETDAPYYTISLTDPYVQKELYEWLGVSKIETTQGAITENAAAAISAIESRLPGLRTPTLERPGVCPVCRIEFFWMKEPIDGPVKHGAVLFDKDSRPLLHIVNALLGCESSDTTLSKIALSHLGVPPGIFDSIQDELKENYQGKSYSLIVYQEEQGSWIWTMLQ